jgi:hypothetical protein
MFTRLSLPTARMLPFALVPLLEVQEEGRNARRVQEFC